MNDLISFDAKYIRTFELVQSRWLTLDTSPPHRSQQPTVLDMMCNKNVSIVSHRNNVEKLIYSKQNAGEKK